MQLTNAVNCSSIGLIELGESDRVRRFQLWCWLNQISKKLLSLHSIGKSIKIIWLLYIIQLVLNLTALFQRIVYHLLLLTEYLNHHNQSSQSEWLLSLVAMSELGLKMRANFDLNTPYATDKYKLLLVSMVNKSYTSYLRSLYLSFVVYNINTLSLFSISHL